MRKKSLILNTITGTEYCAELQIRVEFTTRLYRPYKLTVAGAERILNKTMPGFKKPGGVGGVVTRVESMVYNP